MTKHGTFRMVLGTLIYRQKYDSSFGYFKSNDKKIKTPKEKKRWSHSKPNIENFVMKDLYHVK